MNTACLQKIEQFADTNVFLKNRVMFDFPLAATTLLLP
jgi:hypothetical protein